LTRLLTTRDDGGNETELELAETERKLREVPAALDAPRDYLNEVARILAHPEKFISLRQEHLNLTRLSIKADSQSSQSANAITLAELEIPDVLKRVVTIVHYPRAEMIATPSLV
jgi:hypothetical protein